MKLKGKKALVTAAGQGIGRSTAELFRENGAEVYACDINQATLDTLSGMKTIQADVTKYSDVENIFNITGGVDVLFNGVGFVHGGTILECDENQWDQAFDINVKSMYQIIKLYLPYMIEKGSGSIINMSSVASSLAGVVNRFSYSASKAAIIGITKSVAKDFVGKGVRCNAIAPGGIFNNQDGEFVKKFSNTVPSGRMLNPEEIVSHVAYLTSSDSQFLTGQNIVVDGGISL